MGRAVVAINARMRLATYEREEEVPKGVRLSDEQRQQIYTAFVMNESVEDIADRYGICKEHARKVIRDQRKARESMASREKVVAGDKRNGRLTSTPDPHRFEGTCVINGKAKSRTFTAVNARNATDQWETWCQNLRDEDEFMARVERRDQNQDEHKQEQVDVTPSPIPDITVRPWREVAEERQAEIDALNEKVASLEAKLAEHELASKDRAEEPVAKEVDRVVAATELPEPKLKRWFNDNGTFAVVWRNKPMYVIWAKGEQPRMYGAYQRVDDALKKVDELNDVAAFLGTTGAFEVEEVEWK